MQIKYLKNWKRRRKNENFTTYIIINMIEIIEIFNQTPIELRVIILGGLIGGIYFIYKEGKNDKK